MTFDVTNQILIKYSAFVWY